MRYWKLCLTEVTIEDNYTDMFLRWQEKQQQSDPYLVLPLLNHNLPAPEIRIHKVLRKCQRDATSLRSQSYQDLF